MRCRRSGTTVGHIVNERTSGETIRDTYGDYIADANGDVTYFEPGVLAPPDAACAEARSAALGAVLRHRWRPARRGDRVPARRERREDARAHQAGQLPLPERAPRRRDRSLFPHRPLHHRLQGAPHERGAGRGVLRPRARSAAGQAARSAPARPRARLLEKEFGIDAQRRGARRKLGDLLGPINGRENWEQIVQIHGRPEAERMPRRSPPRARLGEVHRARATRASMPCAKSAKSSGRPIPRRRRPARSAASLAPPSWSTPRTPPIRPRTPQREMGIVNIAENNLKPLIESWYAK